MLPREDFRPINPVLPETGRMSSERTLQALPPIRIPLSVPEFTADAADAVAQVIRSGWVSTVSPQVQAFETAFCAAIGSPHSLNAAATNSGTAALHLALLALGGWPGG